MKAVRNPTFGLWTMLFVTMVFLLLGTSQSLRPSHFTYKGNGLHKGDQTNNNNLEDERKGELGMELYPTGSSLPDCSHACGPCFPCKRVMVSFKCSVAESCPIVYRCMCRGKYYHVPSN
ncbi:PREDICTED: protein EPIDERMAL PATTERNING FACTOR 2-like [Ipomoea nil]|uniref:protein EPIDERMAL PATTERNING FACTOR 2-like n=1 Tax=Ipomoea nil TaxID=35883 RepID=UPI0009018386|nr:PREDICTED: protein EPIDERMAL PATTERNING FACTOR 2-like [Ipomoea nil]